MLPTSKGTSVETESISYHMATHPDLYIPQHCTKQRGHPYLNPEIMGDS